MRVRLTNAVKPRSGGWRRQEAERTSSDVRVTRNSIDELWEFEFLQCVCSLNNWWNIDKITNIEENYFKLMFQMKLNEMETTFPNGQKRYLR